jgi:uncharacterized protein YbjT (DUF2867 family)
MPTYVVTGATGHVGRALVETLLRSSVGTVRALGRSAERLAPLKKQGAETVVCDLRDRKALRGALTGADAAFLMVPPRPNAADFLAEHRAMADAVADAALNSGVPRLVALSSVGTELEAGTGPILTLRHFEERLREGNAKSVAALRAGYFMENHLGMIPEVVSSKRLSAPISGDVRLPMICTNDVALAAAGLLTAPPKDRWTVGHWIGPEDYTPKQVTRAIAAVIGLPDLRYERAEPQAFRGALTSAGFSPTACDAFLDMHAAFEDGRIQGTVSRAPSTRMKATIDDFAREVFAPAYRAAIAHPAKASEPARPAGAPQSKSATPAHPSR